MDTTTSPRSITVRSADGTRIAVTCSGEGPTLVLVEPAGHHRGFSAFGGLVPLLRSTFTVVTYDRRGRGESGDTAPYTKVSCVSTRTSAEKGCGRQPTAMTYAVSREVEDLTAVLEGTGGVGDVHGTSSGALLAIQAAAQGAPIRRLTLLEPPLDNDTQAQEVFTSTLRDRLKDGGDEAALAFFLESIMPPELVSEMRDGPAWQAMTQVAATLVYDCMISTATGSDTLADVGVPTLVLDSLGSSEDLTGMAATVARHMPDAQHKSLPGGWHGVEDQALASAIRAFLLDDGAVTS